MTLTGAEATMAMVTDILIGDGVTAIGEAITMHLFTEEAAPAAEDLSTVPIAEQDSINTTVLPDSEVTTEVSETPIPITDSEILTVDSEILPMAVSGIPIIWVVSDSRAI
ncbi:hypothetical protein [Chryseobacterium camelliae]|uniref:Uncharacterized protein n=1 Tax=Chryseobacterium camelliae TaxID=1265445 RepID=A0ABU0TEN2_9FLAO|nr:hypothetical protein [Chryseobacterium camelliae]MDQ1095462.1 hypothetical protein [Chryseobacterium camelliae]